MVAVGGTGQDEAMTPDTYLTRLKSDATRLSEMADHDLDAEVPTLRRVSAQERAAEIADRRAAYLHRLPEGTI